MDKACADPEAAPSSAPPGVLGQWCALASLALGEDQSVLVTARGALQSTTTELLKLLWWRSEKLHPRF